MMQRIYVPGRAPEFVDMGPQRHVPPMGRGHRRQYVPGGVLARAVSKPRDRVAEAASAIAYAERKRMYREAHREELREKDRLYRERDREALRARKRAEWARRADEVNAKRRAKAAAKREAATCPA